MRNHLLSLALFSALSVSALCGQSSSDLNSGLAISHDSSLDEFSLSWWGIEGFYYFVLGTEDLVNEPWVYFPYAGKGADAVLGPPPFATNASKMFFRLEYSDDTNSELLTTDYNGAGISAWRQLDLGFNPFEWVDSSQNQIHDAWELHFFGIVGIDPSGNDDADYTNNLEEFELDLDPTVDERASAFNYTYDLVGRLITASNDMVSLTYTLDAEGNILGKN